MEGAVPISSIVHWRSTGLVHDEGPDKDGGVWSLCAE